MEFETVTVSSTGKIATRETRQAGILRQPVSDDIFIDLVNIPGGTFVMGSQKNSDEGPQHEVRVPGFLMGIVEVTQTQWRAVAALPKVEQDLDADPSAFEGNHRPVERISWENAVEFCRRLSNHSGREYRLPSEAEWEYACRAGTTTPFHFGETITTDLANYDGNHAYGAAPKGIFRDRTTKVGSFPANGFGLYDMHGNVWEWCEDDWHGNYKGAPMDGSAWLSAGEQGEKKVVRSGSWVDLPVVCRSASRFNESRDRQHALLGFRIVCASL